MQARACDSQFVLQQGGTQLPYPQKDFWAAADFIRSSTNGSSEVTTLLKVTDPPGLDSIPESPAVFFACAAGRCLGGETFECVPGYTGIACSTCKKGQFFWNSNCQTRCDQIEPQGVVTVFGIIAVVLVWILLNKQTA